MLHLAHQNSIELFNVIFNVALRLLNVLEDSHVLLYDVHDVVDVLTMLRDQSLLFFQNNFDQVLMVTTNSINIVSVFSFNSLISLQWHFSERLRHFRSGPRCLLVCSGRCLHHISLLGLFFLHHGL